MSVYPSLFISHCRALYLSAKVYTPILDHNFPLFFPIWMYIVFTLCLIFLFLSLCLCFTVKKKLSIYLSFLFKTLFFSLTRLQLVFLGDKTSYFLQFPFEKERTQKSGNDLIKRESPTWRVGCTGPAAQGTIVSLAVRYNYPSICLSSPPLCSPVYLPIIIRVAITS